MLLIFYSLSLTDDVHIPGVTPGYTLVKHRAPGVIDFPPWPKVGHHVVTSKWPNCFEDKINETNTTNCWIKLKHFPAAIRSRTITSAGMNRVESIPELSKYDNQTQELWPYVTKDYGIQSSQAYQTSKFLKQNVYGIAKDNLEGQW